VTKGPNLSTSRRRSDSLEEASIRFALRQRLAEVAGEQLIGALAERFVVRIIPCGRGQLDLGADELGSVRLVVVVEPIGENQAPRIVLGCIEDSL
jgi:hypothetical protein